MSTFAGAERLDLPYVGIPTFARVPYDPECSMEADAVVIGAPYDYATQVRPGARFGPRAIRSASTIYSAGPSYDPDRDAVFLDGVRITDLGDVDMVSTQPQRCHENIRATVRAVAERGALPVVLGGDHSVPIPVVRALEGFGRTCVIQFDAHLDYVDERFGVREGNGNVMRRLREMPHVDHVVQLGLRGSGSSGVQDFRDAARDGNVLVSSRRFNELGVQAVCELIPPCESYYVTIDIDVFEPGLLPGTGSPSPGGLHYQQVSDALFEIAKRGPVLGFDLVEVAPVYDPSEVTAQTAARLVLDFLGAIFASDALPPFSRRRVGGGTSPAPQASQ